MEEENMTTETEDHFGCQMDYWRQVEKSEGFDIENVSCPSHMNGMITGLLRYDCQRSKLYPYSILVKHYASVGLHRYNMLEGTSYELTNLMKFNMLSNCVSSFYMTLLAHDQDQDLAARKLRETFQVRVDEQSYGTLDLVVSIARPKPEGCTVITEKKTFIPHFHGGATTDGIFKGELPEWPSDDDLNDGKRFYVVKESEWRDTKWIFMYLELVICATDRSIVDLFPRPEVLSQLEIVKVVIETAIKDVELPPNERLKAKSANVYIMFKGLEKARAPRRIFESGKHVERKAIIRRVIDEQTGYLTLVGKLLGGEYTKRTSAHQSWLKRQRLG